jgi:N-succinyldiaminopimelate aminotransferase
MTPDLTALQPYPFQRLKSLLAGLSPPTLPHIDLSLGEPKAATPQLIKAAIVDNLHGLSTYPSTLGSVALRSAIRDWISQRYAVPLLNAETDILPVNGSREALFAFAQAIIDKTQVDPIVVLPNPFYQIYEGAALLAGATPFFVNCTSNTEFKPDWQQVDPITWQRTQLVYVCSPGNPTGAVFTLAEWADIFALSDQYGFVIAADECYSEIYGDTPPLGALEAAHQLGRSYKNVVVFSSLSKRSNVPGMRSGFVAGDADIIKQFLLYRTYHGSAMSPVYQAASTAAWQDETHVLANQQAYREKFAAVSPILSRCLATYTPAAAFYLWVNTPLPDIEFAQRLFATQHVTVLPGSYLAREAHGINPGLNYIRIALVAPLDDCITAAHRIAAFCATLSP